MVQSVKNIYHWVTSWIYAIACGLPGRKLTIIGVTGTDGKTTTSHLIYDMLNASGVKVALVSTVGARLGSELVDTGYHVTSPDASVLQPLLKKIVNMGFTHLVIEVTSHGLDQNRFAGVKFDIGVVTNITHEHLDYHKSMSNYVRAKAKLVASARCSVLNQDDENFLYLKSVSAGKVIPFGRTRIKIGNSKLKGDYNRYNLSAAITVVKQLGIDDKVVRHVVDNFAGVPGRREEVDLGQKFTAMIDFAHTPNSLKVLLGQLRSELADNGYLILVFGCAGLRDRSKRSLMGKIAVELADKVFVTADDPRTEKLDAIFGQITEGLAEQDLKKVIREDDRQKAIEMAIAMARPGDIVVAAGKGHERSMAFGKKEYPWSDLEVMKEAVKKVI